MPKSITIARTPSIAWVATETRNSTSRTRTMGLRKYDTTSAKSRIPPAAMKWFAMKWRPSNSTRAIPVIICQYQVEDAFGSCANGFSIISCVNGFSIVLPSKYLQRCRTQSDESDQHQRAEEGFLPLRLYEAGMRYT